MSAKKGKAQKRQKTNQTVSNNETPDPLTKKQIDQFEFCLKNVVKFAIFSYKLEDKREQSLVNQSGQMLTAISVVSAAILMAIPILIEYKRFSQREILISAGIALAFLLLSMALALASRWRFKYVTMMTGEELLQEINKDAKNHQYQFQYDSQWINQLDAIQKSKKKNNDLKCTLIRYSMLAFFFAVASLIICSFKIAF